MRLLNSRSDYSRCSLPRLTVEESYEKEKESVKASSDSNKEPSLGRNRNLRKTNGQTKNPADIRFPFKKKNGEDKSAKSVIRIRCHEWSGELGRARATEKI